MFKLIDEIICLYGPSYEYSSIEYQQNTLLLINDAKICLCNCVLVFYISLTAMALANGATAYNIIRQTEVALDQTGSHWFTMPAVYPIHCGGPLPR